MLFCPQCGTDRRHVAPVAPCPGCGAVLAEAQAQVMPARPSTQGGSAPPPTSSASTTPVSPPKLGQGIQRQYKPNATLIVIGVLLLLGAFGLWRITENASLTPVGRAIFVTLLGFGPMALLGGVFHARLATGHCVRCGRQVVLERKSLGWKCTGCKHQVAVAPLTIVSLIVTTVVLAFTVTAVLGAKTSGDDRTGDDEQSSAAPSLAMRQQTLADKRVSLTEDEYQMFMFELNGGAHVTIDVDSLSGPEFEVWTMTETGFRQWEEAARSMLGGEFTYIGELSASKIHRMSRSGRLGADRYYVVIDNTDVGKVSPPANFSNDELIVNVKITARY